MRRGSHNNQTMYHTIREDFIVRSPILYAYFKEVLIRPEINIRMKSSKKKVREAIHG